MNKLIKVVKKLEWSASYSYCTGWSCCPICKGIKPGHGRDEDGDLPTSQGHYSNCELNEALQESKELAHG